MGMYTELVVAFELKQGIPDEVVQILKHMVKNEPLLDTALPDHALFKTDRWDFMLRCDSYYFPGDTHSTIRFDDIAKSHFVTIRSNFKNYRNEIKHFLDWIEPFVRPRNVNEEGKFFIGYSRYEEDTEPELIYLTER